MAPEPRPFPSALANTFAVLYARGSQGESLLDAKLAET